MYIRSRTLNILVVFIVIAIVIVVVASFIPSASAGGNHHHNDQVTNITNIYPTETFYVTETVEAATTATETTVVEQKSSAVALTFALSNMHFDWGTTDWQAAATYGYGDRDNSEAVGVGVAKRFKRVLFSGSFGKQYTGSDDDNPSGFGFGAKTNF